MSGSLAATPATLWWWWGLCAVSAANLLAWAWAARNLRHRGEAGVRPGWPVARLQLLLSAGYVLGCAYRSAFPVYDIPRQVLVDGWWSSVIVGRSVATVAELCFAAQWALLLRACADAAGDRPTRVAAAVLLPVIAAAELCSWHAVLTTSNLGHVLEESLWGLAALGVVATLWRLVRHARGRARPVLLAWTTGGAAYAAYLFAVDVPMYLQRWLADESHGRRYLDLAQGLADASTRWVVSRHWDDWRGEALWMTLYFSVAVWTSLMLVHHADPLRAGPRREALRTGD